MDKIVRACRDLRVNSLRVGLLSLALLGCKKPRDLREIERLGPDPAATDSGRSAARPDVPVVRVLSDRPEPSGALGVRFGMTRAEVAALNTAATIRCRDSGEYLFCARALVPVRTEALATYEFCADHLCSVALDGTRTRDEARVASDYLALAEIARGEMGAPSTESHHVSPGCAGHLALCLASKQAEYTVRWTWRSGFQAMVTADQDENDAFLAQVSLTYITGARARQPESVPLDASLPTAAVAP